MEKWADRNILMFSKGNCNILNLGINDPMCQYMLGYLECTEKAVGVLLAQEPESRGLMVSWAALGEVLG